MYKRQVYDDTTGLAGAGSAYYAGKPAVPNRTGNSGPALVYPSTGDGFRATPGDLVTIATDGTTNPSGTGAHAITLFTSGDPAAVGVPLVLTRAVAPAVRALSIDPDPVSYTHLCRGERSPPCATWPSDFRTAD